MSFTDQNSVMLLIEELLSFIWPSELGKIKTPFPCLTYEEAMLTYGSDKPDIGRYTKVSSSIQFIFFILLTYLTIVLNYNQLIIYIFQ